MNGSLFEDYILNSFDSLTDFINKSIVANIAGYFIEKGRMSKEKVKVLTYAVLYKAICPSNLSKITNLNESHITLQMFLDKMGIPTEYIPEDHEIWQITEILEDVGIIVRIHDFDEKSKSEEHYYIANPSLTYWLIKEIYGNYIPENDILSHIFESYMAVRIFTNMLSEHRIYFYDKNVQEKKDKLFIVTDIEKYHTYLFECKFEQTDSSDSDITLLSGYPDEHEFKDGKIEGRYVVCNRTPVVKTYSVGTVIFTTPGDILDNYFKFNKNVMDILQWSL